MNFFSRKLGTADMATDTATEQNAQRIIHREIEVKVERTWTTLSARAPGMEPQPPQTIRLDEGSR
jgi:hypothetical protein